MELNEYIKIIRQNSKLIIIAGIVTALFSFVFSYMQPVKYETSLSLSIIKEKTQDTDDFKYDGYYAVETSDAIAESIEQWLKSPQIVNEIYQKAGIVSELKNIKEYTKAINAKKMSFQYVEIKLKTSKKEDAEKISSAAIEVINNRLNALKVKSEAEISFSVESESPVIIGNKPDPFINSFIGLISGLMLGMFLVFIKKYVS